jgi:hypothetical protein
VGNQILLSFTIDSPSVKLWHHVSRDHLTDVADSFGEFIDSFELDPDAI